MGTIEYHINKMQENAGKEFVDSVYNCAKAYASANEDEDKIKNIKNIYMNINNGDMYRLCSRTDGDFYLLKKIPTGFEIKVDKAKFLDNFKRIPNTGERIRILPSTLEYTVVDIRQRDGVMYMDLTGGMIIDIRSVVNEWEIVEDKKKSAGFSSGQYVYVDKNVIGSVLYYARPGVYTISLAGNAVDIEESRLSINKFEIGDRVKYAQRSFSFPYEGVIVGYNMDETMYDNYEEMYQVHFDVSTVIQDIKARNLTYIKNEPEVKIDTKYDWIQKLKPGDIIIDKINKMKAIVCENTINYNDMAESIIKYTRASSGLKRACKYKVILDNFVPDKECFVSYNPPTLAIVPKEMPKLEGRQGIGMNYLNYGIVDRKTVEDNLTCGKTNKKTLVDILYGKNK